MISEALLEMHFHSSLIQLFSKTFGKNFLKLLKPSPQNERWVGFDQGWVNTDLSMNEFFNKLKDKINSETESFERLYLAYFFQFKLAEEISRSSKLKPPTYHTPYFRSEISLFPNKTTGISQHETLSRLSKIQNVEVCYVCGMLFDINELYQEPNLSKLRFVPLDCAPTGWTTNERHFITFQTHEDENPLWCSEPIEGKSFKIEEIFSREKMQLLNPQELLKLLASINTEFEKLTSKEKTFKRDRRIETYYPECLTIIEFEKPIISAKF